MWCLQQALSPAQPPCSCSWLRPSPHPSPARPPPFLPPHPPNPPQGTRVCDMAERFGAEVAEIKSAPGAAFSLAELTAAVEAHKPALLYLCQGDSSTGVHQNLAGVGECSHWGKGGRERG